MGTELLNKAKAGVIFFITILMTYILYEKGWVTTISELHTNPIHYLIFWISTIMVFTIMSTVIPIYLTATDEDVDLNEVGIGIVIYFISIFANKLMFMFVDTILPPIQESDYPFTTEILGIVWIIIILVLLLDAIIAPAYFMTKGMIERETKVIE